MLSSFQTQKYLFTPLFYSHYSCLLLTLLWASNCWRVSLSHSPSLWNRKIAQMLMESFLQYFFKENVFLCSHFLVQRCGVGHYKNEEYWCFQAISALVEWPSVSKQPNPFPPEVLIYHIRISAVVGIPLFIPLAEKHFQFSALASRFAKMELSNSNRSALTTCATSMQYWADGNYPSAVQILGSSAQSWWMCRPIC